VREPALACLDGSGFDRLAPNADDLAGPWSVPKGRT